MEQPKDGMEAMERYESARAKLAHLIDNPEKHLPVDAYRSHIRKAQRDVARAHRALLAVGAW